MFRRIRFAFRLTFSLLSAAQSERRRLRAAALLLGVVAVAACDSSSAAAVEILQSAILSEVFGTQQEDQRQEDFGAGTISQSLQLEGVVYDIGGFPSGNVRGAAAQEVSTTIAELSGTAHVVGWGLGNAGTAYGSGFTEALTRLQVHEPTRYTLNGSLEQTPFDGSISSWRTMSLCLYAADDEAARPVCQLEVTDFDFEDTTERQTLEEGELSPGVYELRVRALAGGTFSTEATMDVAYSLWLAPHAGDLDRIGQALRTGHMDLQFDVDHSGVVDDADIDWYVHDHAQTWYGDHDLDGLFDTGDLVSIFQAAQYDDGVPGNSTWATGDWNLDGEFDSRDLVVALRDGGFEAGYRAELTAAVPEPAGAGVIGWLLAGAILRRRSAGQWRSALTPCHRVRGKGWA